MKQSRKGKDNLHEEKNAHLFFVHNIDKYSIKTFKQTTN